MFDARSLAQDFALIWLVEPEDLEVMIGLKDEVDLDTPEALGEELRRTAISLIEQEMANYTTTGAYYDGRTVGIALATTKWLLEQTPAWAIGERMWEQYSGEKVKS